MQKATPQRHDSLGFWRGAVAAEPDVDITPRIGHIGWLDFHRAAESITVGRTATEKAIDSIAESIADLS